MINLINTILSDFNVENLPVEEIWPIPIQKENEMINELKENFEEMNLTLDPVDRQDPI